MFIYLVPINKVDSRVGLKVDWGPWFKCLM